MGGEQEREREDEKKKNTSSWLFWTDGLFGSELLSVKKTKKQQKTVTSLVC